MKRRSTASGSNLVTGLGVKSDSSDPTMKVQASPFKESDRPLAASSTVAGAHIEHSGFIACELSGILKLVRCKRD
eukprot:1153195-Pelagomonas_calceolata.AAC.4